jgi:D-glycero-D-manno-heptose 1,7-bisphosphate phosphatase
VFLDRDGTINIEKDYLYRIEDFEFIPGVPLAIKTLKDAGFLVIVVTNQSGVARGYYQLSDVDLLHAHIQRCLSAFGATVDAFYVCPHHPTEGLGEFRRECQCRKGAPGMLLQAADDFDIDLKKSYIVGDKLADVEAGERAGCSTIMVKTGHGEKASRNLLAGKTPVCEDLSDAVAVILGRPG